MTGADLLREEGREQGREQGRAEGRASSLLLLIERKFGAVADDVRERVRAGTDKEHERWLERILTATTLRELFND